jgi:hypothetical protein
VSRGALMPVVARTAEAATARASGTSFNDPSFDDGD